MAKSVTQERKVTFYPDPYYKKLLEGLKDLSGDSKSSIANKALREMFDKMPSLQKQQLLSRIKK